MVNVKTFTKMKIILVLLSIVYIIALPVAYMQYEHWCNERLESYPPEVQPYVDFTPFFFTTVGTILAI